MNTSSTVSSWLTSAIRRLLEAGIPSARLDAELILTHTLRKPRTWLHAHDDDVLDPRHIEIADARLALRLDRVPVAYILGHKDFYGRRFGVTSATLIPRPESEAIIELLLALPEPLRTGHLVDVGTGSGCLGITAKLELPSLAVTLLDVDNHALQVAKKNANTLHADVEIIQSNLLQHYPYTASIIVANLPYVDPEWERSPETNHEPALALFANDNGLSLINELIEQTDSKLQPGGVLFIEADVRQHHAITHYADKYGLDLSATSGLILQFARR